MIPEADTGTPNYPSAADQQCLALSELLFKERERVRELEAALRDVCSLDWCKGPAEGGTGTAPNTYDGQPQWYDGDRLLIIVNTYDGQEMSVVDISAGEDYFVVRDASTGDTYDAWNPADWSWWAKLTSRNLPPSHV